MADFLDSNTSSMDAKPKVQINLLAVFWRKKAILFLGLVIGLIIGSIQNSQKPAIFQSATKLIVLKRRSEPVPTSTGSSSLDFRNAYVEDYVSTQEIIIRSHEVLQLAAARLKSMPMKQPPADYVGYISMGMGLTRISAAGSTSNNGTNVLTITFTGGNAQDCEYAVNSIVDGYRDFIASLSKTATSENLNALLKARDKDIEDRTKLQDSLKDIRKKIRESHIEVSLDDLKNRSGVLDTRLFELSNRKIEIDNQIALITRQRDKVNPEELLYLLALPQDRNGSSPLASNQRLPFANDKLQELEDELNDKMVSFGPDHPQVIVLQKRIDRLNNRLLGMEKEPFRPNPKQKSQSSVIDLYIQKLKSETETITSQEESTKNSLKKIRVQLNELEPLLNDELNAKKSLEELAKEITTLNGRLEALDLSKDSSAYDARILDPAGPGVKIGPNLMRGLMLPAMMGMILGIGIALLGEFTDRSFRSPEDIRQRLGVAVIGHVPHLTAPETIEQTGLLLDPLLLTYHNPKSTEAEVFRGLRTSIYFSTRGKGHQVIQITSPNPHDGKSTTVANLAISIAQSGKKIILIDCDLRRPRVHELFGITNKDKGFSSVLMGEEKLEDAVQSCAVPGLTILPCGPRPANPAELLTSARFKEFIDQVRLKYDFVLIDSPPLLAVTDPAVVASRVDGTILVINLMKNNRSSAERARDILVSIGANLLGVVAQTPKKNQVAGYTYGYSYNYDAYSYSYGYAEEYVKNDVKEDAFEESQTGGIKKLLKVRKRNRVDQVQEGVK